MYRIVFPILLLIYIAVKYRLIRGAELEPTEGKVLYPRQDARLVHGAMSILESIFVLEFISHATRDSAAFGRLGLAMAFFLAVDGWYWLKLKNFAITYDQSGLNIRNMWGKEKVFAWNEIQQVHTSGTGVKHARHITLRTSRGRFRINEKSGGLQRFRRFMEEQL
ncbi:hypothetical protein DSECCO2_540590 [anaerobic digester metagenome]|nr:hypothetical protein NQU17_06830 [Clostridiaceae bacterium HFYG-1003]